MALCDFIWASLQQEQIYSFTGGRNGISPSASRTRSQAGWVFSHMEIRVGIFFLDQHLIQLNCCFPTQKSGLGFFGDQHLIQLSCNAHPRARSLKSTLGISLVPQGSASCTSLWIFTGCHSPTSSLLPFKKIQISGVKWVGQRIYKKYLSSS